MQKEKEASKKEIDKLNKSIAEIKEQVAVAEDSGDNEELGKLQSDIIKAEKKLMDYKVKIEELEQQLQAPLESVIVEKAPDEIEKELAELRAKAEGGGIKAKFKIHFDILVGNFDDLLGDLEEMADNEELHDKYRNAVHGLIDRMVERL